MLLSEFHQTRLNIPGFFFCQISSVHIQAQKDLSVFLDNFVDFHGVIGKPVERSIIVLSSLQKEHHGLLDLVVEHFLELAFEHVLEDHWASGGEHIDIADVLQISLSVSFNKAGSKVLNFSEILLFSN